MMVRLLAWLATQVVQRPARAIAVVTVPSLLLGALSFTVPTDLSFTGVIDQSNPEVAKYFETSERLELGGLLPLLLEGEEDELDAAARAVSVAIEPLRSVRHVLWEPPQAWMKDNAVYLVDRETFDLWLELATRPEDGEVAEALTRRLLAKQEEVNALRPEGYRVVLVVLDGEPLDLDTDGEDYFELEQVTLKALERFGVEGTYAGLPAVGAQDQRRTLQRVQLLTPLSLLLVLLLFRLVERRFLRLAVVVIPMLLTVAATLGATGAILGSITILESFFGVMVFGLGIDFALHLMVRLQEERAQGARFEEAVRNSLTGTGRGIVAGGLTTAGAFAVVALAPDPMARHLGVSGAVGLTVCLVLMLTLLPAFWTFFERRSGHRRAETDELAMPLVSALSAHAARRPWVHVGIALLFLVLAAAGMPRFSFETDLRKVLFNRQVPAAEAMLRVQEQFDLNPSPWIVARGSLEEARKVGEKLLALDVVASVESAATWLQADGAERKAALRAAQEDITAQRRTYAALIPLATDDEAERLKEVDQLLGALEAGVEQTPPTPRDLPETLKARLIGPSGELIVYAYVAEPSLDGTVAKEERAQIQSVAPDATGDSALIEAVMDGNRPWAIPIFLAILAFICVVLLVDTRDFRLLLLAITPVVLGSLLTFGILCWVGRPFHVLSTLVVPLIIGLGVDDGIHVVHRLKASRTTPPDVAASSVGKAIVMTTLTTCSSFVVLLFTDHPGLEGMALIMLIGLPIALVASITTLPALAVILRVDRATVDK